MNKYRITHTYALDKTTFYGVETEFSVTELNYAMAYLQMIHFRMPCFVFLDGDLGEQDMLILLNRIYGIAPLTQSTAVSKNIDIYENWTVYTCNLTAQLLKINVYARSGVRQTILGYMFEIGLVRMEQLKAKSRSQYQQAIIELEQLKQVLAGNVVKAEWKWVSVDGTPLSNTDYSSQNGADLIVND